MDAIGTIGSRIKQIRKARGVTQQVFADRLGLKHNTIATYEIDRTFPSDRTIQDICERFHVNESWLRYGTGEMDAETTQQQKLTRFFADVLATAPDERSAFIAALDDLPPEFWPIVVELARKLVENIKKKED